MLSLTGVLVAAFVPTFLKHVHTSKLAEPTQLLEAMHRHAASYYESSLAQAGAARGCLPASAGPYPLTPSSAPASVDFQADLEGAATWKALGLQQPQLLRYSYLIEVSEPCSPRGSIRFQAQGDLDEDGTLSLLERTSVIEQHKLVPRGPLRIVSRLE